MGMILIFNRKVIPIEGGEKGAATVETEILGFVDGEGFKVGAVNFPSKPTWTKFWGALQRGALAVPDLEVKMQNVMPDVGVPELEEVKSDSGEKIDSGEDQSIQGAPSVRFIGAQNPK